MTGTYSDIVEIVAPPSAVANSRVDILAKVKNLADYAIYIGATGNYDSLGIPFSPDYAAVGTAAIQEYSSSFTMPDKDVRVTVYSSFWTGSEWFVDDAAYVDIKVAALAPEINDFAIGDYVKL